MRTGTRSRVHARRLDVTETLRNELLRGRTKPGTELWKQGFWYGDPNRVFVESTHAHNTVEVGGESYNRSPVPPTFQQLDGPSADSVCLALCPEEHGSGTLNQKMSQVAIPRLGDATKFGLAA